MTARPRLLGTAFALVALAGCGTAGTPVAAPKAPAAQAVDMAVAAAPGRVEVRLSGLAARRLMATTAQVAKLKVTLSGGPLTAPRVQEVATTALTNGKGTVAFDAIPNGTINVAIEALDAGGAKIGEKATTATIQGGQTAVIAVALKLDATHVASTDGDLEIDLEVQDGDVIVDPIASPSPRPSSPVLSPAPSPTPTPSPTPVPSPGPAALEDVVNTWFADGTMAVDGMARNNGSVTTDIQLSVAFRRKGLFGWATAETKTITMTQVGPGDVRSFHAVSAEKVSTLFSAGEAVVTITKP